MRKLALAAFVAVLLIAPSAQASTGWARWDHDTYIRWHSHVSKPTTESIAAWVHYREARHRAIVQARHAHTAWLDHLRAVEAQRVSQAQPGAPSQGGGYSGSGGCAHGYVHDLIVRFFGSESGHALFVAERESHCIPTAYNPTRLKLGHASGVAQILAPGNWEPWSRSCGYGGASVFSAYANVGTWACIVHRSGWGPWGG